MAESASGPVSAAQISQFQRDGFTILPDVIDVATLTMLREECAYFVGYIDGSMKARDREVYGITHRGRRYFISNRSHHSPRTSTCNRIY